MDVYDKAIALGGMSKSLSGPGLRIGWLAMKSTELMQRIMSLKDYTTICSSAPSEVWAPENVTFCWRGVMFLVC